MDCSTIGWDKQTMNHLQPLAKVLLETGVLCPKAVEQFYGPQHDAVTAGQFRRDHQGCSLCGGTGKVWPEPLRWLAEQVLRKCSVCGGSMWRQSATGPDSRCDCHATGGWMPKDPVALEWPEGWPDLLRWQLWSKCCAIEGLRREWGYAQAFWEKPAIASLVEAVQAIAREAKP